MGTALECCVQPLTKSRLYCNLPSISKTKRDEQIETNKMYSEKLDGNCTKMLRATPHKTAAVLPSASHLLNYSSVTNNICEARGER